MNSQLDDEIRNTLQRGTVIPAHPLALNAERRLDERRQRALSRYYIAAGAGGLAVGVHTTQFAIREPQYGLYRPVLAMAAEEMDRGDALRPTDRQLVRVAGVIGNTQQAVAEAMVARELGYHTALLGLGALKNQSDDQIVEHCRAIAEIIPVFGFYLQAAVGGRPLSFDFWRQFAEIENVVAIKVAAFNRYQTLDVVRALAETGRHDIALYTGNDDNLVLDLLTPYRFQINDRIIERRFVGGLLGHWAVWTSSAVAMLDELHALARSGAAIPQDCLATAMAVTDCNAVLFDAANNFAGCIPGIHEVLRRQGLLKGRWCLDPHETLSAGQSEGIDRIYAAYPHLSDDQFVAEHLDQWLQ